MGVTSGPHPCATRGWWLRPARTPLSVSISPCTPRPVSSPSDPTRPTPDMSALLTSRGRAFPTFFRPRFQGPSQLPYRPQLRVPPRLLVLVVRVPLPEVRSPLPQQHPQLLPVVCVLFPPTRILDPSPLLSHSTSREGKRLGRKVGGRREIENLRTVAGGYEKRTFVTTILQTHCSWATSRRTKHS